MQLEWIPVVNAWELNERHYGALQGLNKAETAQKFGEAQVKLWRRSYDVPPPALELTDERHPRFDPRYAALRPDQITGDEVAEDHAGARAALLAQHAGSRHSERQARAGCGAREQPAGDGQVPGQSQTPISLNSTFRRGFRWSMNWMISSKVQALLPGRRGGVAKAAAAVANQAKAK